MQPHRNGEKVPKADEGRSRRASALDGGARPQAPRPQSATNFAPGVNTCNRYDRACASSR